MIRSIGNKLLLSMTILIISLCMSLFCLVACTNYPWAGSPNLQRGGQCCEGEAAKLLSWTCHRISDKPPRAGRLRTQLQSQLAVVSCHGAILEEGPKAWSRLGVRWRNIPLIG